MAAEGRTRARVLVVDDDVALARAVARQLASRFDVTVVSGVAQAVERLGSDVFAAILTDHDMPDGTGLTVLVHASTACPAARRILTSGDAPGDLPQHLGSGLVQRFVPKPASGSDWLDALADLDSVG